MARQVMFDGRVIATVPDDTTEAEEAQIVEEAMADTAGPLTAPAVSAATTGSAAPAPSQRSSRGPVQATTPDDIRMARPRTIDRGYWGELLGSINPVEIAGNTARTWGKAILGAVATPFLQSEDENENLDPAYRAEAPELLPDLPGIYREAKRRGAANESTLGMYGQATGQALIGGLGLGAGRMVRSAPTRMAAAEADYATAVGDAPLPIAREMMQRGIVAGPTPSAQAAPIASRAAALNAQRAAIPPPAKVRGAKGRFEVNTDPIEMARGNERAALGTSARLESDIATILEAMPESQTIAGAAGKGVSRFANSRLTAMVYGPGAVVSGATGSLHSLAAISPVAAIHLLTSVAKQLTRTNQWKTAAPIYRYRFMNAMLRGDADVAAATGALIASGDAHSDSRAASSTPATSAAPSPAPSSSSSDPPEYNDRSGMIEWPRQEGSRNENDSLLMRRTSSSGKPLKYPVPVLPSTLLPSHFENTRKTAWGTPADKVIPASEEAVGRFGLEFDLKKRREQRAIANTVMVSADAADQPNVYTHELGHAAYEFDVPVPVKQTFQRMTNKVVQDIKQDIQANGPSPRDRAALEATFERLVKRYPRAIVFNLLVHGGNMPMVYHEAFSELFGQYMSNPSEFDKTYPGFYEYYKRDVFRGKEYKRIRR